MLTEFTAIEECDFLYVYKWIAGHCGVSLESQC